MKARFIGSALLLVCAAAWCASTQRAGASSNVAEQYLFAAANRERVQRGLGLLRWDSSLYAAADRHAHEMAERASISHQYAGEPELSARAREAGARFSVIAENVAEAPTAVRTHEAWMRSPEHRANLLDPRVNSVGIRVIGRVGELYAVEDFDRSVTMLSLREQEAAVGDLLQSRWPVAVLPSSQDARRTCAMETGYTGPRAPGYIMRYTAAGLNRLPSALQAKLSSGRYRAAQVGACAASGTRNFSAYRIAVMLYP